MKRLGTRQLHGLWIPVHTVHEVLVMQVRAGCKPGHPDVTDDVALLHVGADAHVRGEARHVTVKSRHAVAVSQYQRIAIAASLARKADSPVSRGMYGRTGRSRIVGTHVPANAVQDRMHAVRIEYRADSGEFDGCSQERLAHGQTVRCVVAGAARIGHESHRAIQLATVDELCGQYLRS